VGEGEEGRCTGECEEKCDSTQCGTDACSDAAVSMATNAEEMLAGLQSCTGAYAAYAGYVQYGAAYLLVAAVEKLTKCGLELPASLAPDPTTCGGAVQILSSLSTSCPCPELCTGGTGSCDVGEGEEGRCTGECEEKCDSTQCGTDACSDAAVSMATNAEEMLAGLQSCTGAYAAYAGYAQYGAAYLEGAAREKLTNCGLDVPAYLADSCPLNGCVDGCPEGYSPKDCDELFTMLTTGCGKDCAKCKKEEWAMAMQCEIPADDDEPTTCGMVKEAYKANECCGKPEKKMSMSAKRLQHKDMFESVKSTLANKMKENPREAAKFAKEVRRLLEEYI